MSVSSVRRTVNAALADKKVTKAEAKEIGRIASRTSGVSEGEKKEIRKALDGADKFEAGARAILESFVSGVGGSVSPALVKAVQQYVESKGFAVCKGLGLEGGNVELSEKLEAAIDVFNRSIDASGAAEEYAREVKVGGQKLVIASDHEWKKQREVVAFFTHEGQEVARLAVSDRDVGQSMKWLALGGKAVDKSIVALPKDEAKFSKAFVQELEKFVEEHYGELGGKDVAEKQLPEAVRLRYDLMKRYIADGTGAEKLTFKGQTLYALHDYSCVTSVHLFTPGGTRLAHVTE